MKTNLLNIASTLVILFLSISSNAKNIFDDIKSAEASLAQNKYTLVYIYTSWCGASKMEFDTLSTSLLKNRNRFNFIVLTDSISYNSLSENIKSLKPDAFLLIDKYFKYRMHDKKEAKEMGRQFVKRYDYEFVNTSLASGILYLEFPNHNLNKLFWNDNVPRVVNYLESIPECK